MGLTATPLRHRMQTREREGRRRLVVRCGLVAVVLLVGAYAAGKAGLVELPDAEPPRITPADVVAIRTEAGRLEQAMLDAWKAHGQAFEEPMGWEERKAKDPRHKPDVWHHKEAIERALFWVRANCEDTLDAILYGHDDEAQRLLARMREQLRQAWLHQELWRAGRPH